VKEFYVGYLPASPPGIRSRVRIFVAAIFVLALAGAILFAASQRHFADSHFEFGRPKEFVGTLLPGPFPSLLGTNSAEPNAATYPYLLCAPGKHGADSLVQSYSGKNVKLRGTLIYRQEGRMIEVIPGSITGRAPSTGTDPQAKDLGESTLTGEIVDTKCFLGVMNPGEGKVHRECAALCLSGGIPPALFTRDLDGTPRILLITDHSGAPLPQSVYLQRVGQPVRIFGHAFESNGLLYLRASEENITALP